jgi:XTP/dITP diphosphohydrolase
MTAAGPRTILVATRNAGKVREIAALLGEDGPEALRGISWRSLDEVAPGEPDPVEDQPTFAGNAALKARYWSKRTGLWTLADDSGLEVDALGGAPGVYSARYAALQEGIGNREQGTGRGDSGNTDWKPVPQDAANNRKLIAALAGVTPERRTARFRCCLALADGERIVATSEGTIEGVIIDEPRGSGGFGYDPHFLVPSLGKTTAELSLAEKNRISHRGRALRVMRREIARALGA